MKNPRNATTKVMPFHVVPNRAYREHWWVAHWRFFDACENRIVTGFLRRNLSFSLARCVIESHGENTDRTKTPEETSHADHRPSASGVFNFFVQVP